MSTKTTIKRVALVAAVALTLGGFSSVSANAAYNSGAAGTAAKISQDATTGDAGVGGVAGPANSLVVNIQQAQDTPTATGNQYGAFVTVTGGTILAAYETTTALTVETGTVGTAAASAANAAIATTGASVVLAGGTVAIRSLKIATPTAGSIVINVYNATTKGANPSSYNTTADATLTLTVNATAVSGTYSAANSTFYDTITVGSPADAALTTTPVVSSAVSTTSVVHYTSALKDALKANMSSATSWSVTLTGPGTLSAASNGTAKARVLTGTGPAVDFYLYGDGTSGSTVVTQSIGSTVVSTKNVTFYGTTVASISAAAAINYVASSGSPTSAAIKVTAKDANGNVIPNAVISATADAANTVATIASSATTDSTGVASFAVTGLSTKYGVAKFAFADSTAKITSSASVTVSGVVATALTVTPDVATAAAGDKITYTLSATDANSLPLADGTYTFFAAKPVVSTSLGSNPLDSTTVTLVDGQATGVAYAPAAGKVVISWTLVGTLASAVASGPVGATLVGTTISTSVDVSGSADSSLAVDAANAATDAANAAAEEASNATEAASEALAAVNSLATTVASLIAGIKAQLTSLTALIKKIQAKVKA